MLRIGDLILNKAYKVELVKNGVIELINIHSKSIFVIVLVLLTCSVNFSSSMASSSTNRTASIDTSTAVLIWVDQSGHGNYKKIQDAIDAVPNNNSELVFIWVKPGIYREKIVVPANKPYITLSGTRRKRTVISWNENGEIYDSPTMTVFAPDFVGRFLTIQNTHGENGKAVALRVAGDRAAFYACKIKSYRDTLLDGVGRHYYSNCYIQGAIDFIFGDATSLYEKCQLHYSSGEAGGAIAAQRRESGRENTGFSFVRCKITGEAGGKVYLGRPWRPYSRVVYALTYMSAVVIPQGWDDWGKNNAHSTAYYGEYNCYGPGSNRSERVAWSHALTPQEAAPFISKRMIGGAGWLRPLPTAFKKRFSVSSSHVKPN
ncbi:hypothetical protein V2J09_018689 [Rumex salicifolius]